MPQFRNMMIQSFLQLQFRQPILHLQDILVQGHCHSPVPVFTKSLLDEILCKNVAFIGGSNPRFELLQASKWIMFNDSGKASRILNVLTAGNFLQNLQKLHFALVKHCRGRVITSHSMAKQNIICNRWIYSHLPREQHDKDIVLYEIFNEQYQANLGYFCILEGLPEVDFFELQVKILKKVCICSYNRYFGSFYLLANVRFGFSTFPYGQQKRTTAKFVWQKCSRGANDWTTTFYYYYYCLITIEIAQIKNDTCCR